MFFIPLIPFKAKRELICPVCHTKYPVAKRHVDATNDMLGVTAQWRAHSMSDADYDARVEAYWALTSSTPLSGLRELPPLGLEPNDPSKLPPPPGS